MQIGGDVCEKGTYANRVDVCKQGKGTHINPGFCRFFFNLSSIP